jgi:hypothetical protein
LSMFRYKSYIWKSKSKNGWGGELLDFLPYIIPILRTKLSIAQFST